MNVNDFLGALPTTKPPGDSFCWLRGRELAEFGCAGFYADVRGGASNSEVLPPACTIPNSFRHLGVSGCQNEAVNVREILQSRSIENHSLAAGVGPEIFLHAAAAEIDPVELH